MSQIDVRNAKLALATRLRQWGTPGDTAMLAAGFIDDLVEQGWQVAAFRETRPHPPLAHQACRNCGRELAADCCENPLREKAPTPNYAEHAKRARAELHPPQERTVTT